MPLLIRWGFSVTRAYLDVPALMVLSCVTVPGFTALLFMIGKYTLYPLSSVVKMNKFCCCIRARFPRTQVPGLLKDFTERVHGRIDSLIEE
jgi:hypothetical protein